MTGSSPFAGRIAPILASAVRPTSFLTGTVVGALLAAVTVVVLRAGAPGAAVPLWTAIASVALVRIAKNAAAGDARGGFLDASGGSWGETLAVAARVAAMNLVWCVPLGSIVPASADGGAFGLPTGPAALLLLVAAVVLPLGLACGVSARSAGEALAPATWGRVFGTRGHDVLALLVVFLGGLLSTVAATAILVTAFGAWNATLGIFLGLVAGAWGLGVSLNLLGGLVGGFLESAADVADSGSTERDAASSGTAPVARPLDFDPTPWGSREESGPVRVFGASGPVTGFGAPRAPVESSVSGRRPAFVQTVNADKPKPAVESDSVLGRLRANERIEDDDRELALEDAEHMMGQFGPHPQVLARIAVLQHRLGRAEARDTARRAAEAARAVNNAGVLADLYEELRSEADELEFGEHERLRMASSLSTRGRHDAAIDLYEDSLARQPHSLGLVKAMIQLADEGLRDGDGAERALRIYDVIERHWTDHPFVDFVDRGRDRARRTLERVPS